MSAETLSPEIDELIRRSVQAAFVKETETVEGQVRLAALLERYGWTCRAPAPAVECVRRKEGGANGNR